jgi:hypothetical protein
VLGVLGVLSVLGVLHLGRSVLFANNAVTGIEIGPNSLGSLMAEAHLCV